MTTVITRMFETYSEAAKAVGDLEASGIAHSDISIIANNADNQAVTHTGTDTVSATDPDAPATGAGAGATVGTLVGGGVGLLTGLGLLAIPGVGPVVAAGWLVATLSGAGVGAAAGGLLGGLTGAGVPEEHAHVYAEGIRRGGTLVTVRAPEGQGAQVDSVLAKYATVDPATRGEEYRQSGWSKFDDTAPAYTNTMGTGVMGTGVMGAGIAGTGVMGTGLGAASDPLTGTRTPIV